MPNWTNNKLVISHIDASKIALLKEGAINDRLFDSVIPMPEEIKSTKDGWYEWSVQNWGTKWDACEISIQSESSNSISLVFESAWSAPYVFLKQLATKGYEFTHYFIDEDGGIGLITNESISLSSPRTIDAARFGTIANEQLVFFCTLHTLEEIQTFIKLMGDCDPDKSTLQSFLDLGLQSRLDYAMEEESLEVE